MCKDKKFNINISDSFARSSELLLDTLSKLFVENKEPKEEFVVVIKGTDN